MSNKLLASPLQNSHFAQLQNQPQKQLAVASISCVFQGVLNGQAIEDYLNQLIRGFEILRTGYYADEFGALWQDISEQVAINYTALDWRAFDETKIDAAKEQIFGQLDQHYVAAPWHKVVLADMGETSWLYLELAGINTDAFSLNYLLETLLDAGSGRLGDNSQLLHEKLIQYSELAPWLSDFLLADELNDARAFWSRNKSIAALEQQFSLSRYTQPSARGYATTSIGLGDVFDNISNYAAGHGASNAELVCASLRFSLGRYSPQARLTRVFDSRADESLADAVGPLSRAVPLFPPVADSFAAALAHEVECSSQGLDYAECFAKEHDHQAQGFTFIFDAINRSSDTSARVEKAVYLSQQSKMQFTLIAQGNETHLQVTYDENYIDEEAINYFLASCKADLLNAIASNTASRPSYVLSGSDSHQSDYVTVLDPLAQAVDIPLATVTEIDGQTASLAQIDANANRLANYLSTTGIGKGDVIALCLTRSIDFVTTMLAVMKTGAAYVPVDIELPLQRITSMLQDAQANALISHGNFEVKGCHTIDYAALDLSSHANTAPAVAIGPDDLAYILFTSGSTGKAKGVSISHKALLNQMSWINQEFSFTPQDRFLQRTSASFDASIWEFWSPLLVGATMVIAPRDINYDMAMFKHHIWAQKITRMQIVPSLLELLVDQVGDDEGCSLKTVFCGGEALKTVTARKTSIAFDCEIVNLYGPSECCVNATFWRYSDDLTTDFVPIGYPIDNLICRVVKADGSAADKGESGELYIGGDSLFSGYYNQPAMSEAALHLNADDQKTYYKSGDNVCILADGNLMFLERLDDQVKLNGYRIEPEEVSMQIINSALAEQAACIFNESNQSLSLFYIGAKVSENEMRQALANSLPEYMVPQQWIMLEIFPYLSNGKLDKRALVKQAENYSSDCYVAPVSEIEKQLVEIWQELLETSINIGINHDFFTIGGHSILAMKVLSRIIEAFDIDISVRVLFEHKTIAELAAYIEPLTLLNDSNETHKEEEMEGGLL